MLTFPTPDLDPDVVRARACTDLYPFARAHALDSAEPVPALICDAAASIAVAHGATLPAPPPDEAATVAHTRALRRGSEPVGAPYALPNDLTAATDALLDLARQYAAARPGFVADAVTAIEDRMTHARLKPAQPGVPERRVSETR